VSLRSFTKITRINFLPASLIPFLIGTAFAFKNGYETPAIRFIPALLGVLSAHLAGNVLNNYFDYRSGADDINVKRSPFFGGSRVIHHGEMGPLQVLALGLGFLLFSFLCGIFIFLVTKNPVIIILGATAGLLTYSYTAPPLKLAYRRLGEVDIFVLFGVLLVMGGFYLFAEIFTFSSFLISLPISFLIAGVILCNEVPDHDADAKAGKKNLISLTGKENSYILYAVSMILAAASIIVNIYYGNLPAVGLLLLVLFILGLQAIYVLKKNYKDFDCLIDASKKTITLHALAGLANIILLII